MVLLKRSYSMAVDRKKKETRSKKKTKVMEKITLRKY
jgi:hypothetical protein